MRAIVVVGAVVSAVAIVITSIVLLRDGDNGQHADRDLLGAGHEIGDGFVVAPGSELLGTRFPQPGLTYPAASQRGWQALLLVTGDPLELFNAYVGQATRLTGYELPLAPEACGREVSPPEPYSIYPLGLDDPVPEGAQVLSVVCQADVYTPSSQLSGTTIGVHLWYTEARSHEPYASHIQLRFASWGDPSSPAPSTPVAPSSAMGPTPAVAARPPVPDLPAEGEPLDRRRKPSADRAVVTIEPGSELIAPMAPVTCVTGGYQGVLRITGDPEQVVKRYARQFSAAFLLPEVAPLEGVDDGLRVVEVRPEGSGFGDLWAVAVVIDPETAYLHIERCND